MSAATPAAAGAAASVAGAPLPPTSASRRATSSATVFSSASTAAALDQHGPTALEVLGEACLGGDQRRFLEGEARLVGAGACEVGAPDPRRGRRVLRRAHTVLHGARGVDPLAGGGERRRGLLHGVLRLLAETRPQAEHAGQAKAHAHQSPMRPWSAATLSSYEARWSSGWRRNAVTSGSHAIASSIPALEPLAYAPIWIRSSASRWVASQPRTRAACASCSGLATSIMVRDRPARRSIAG